MKYIKTASGKTQLKISKSEWKAIGKKAGWLGNLYNKWQKVYGSDWWLSNDVMDSIGWASPPYKRFNSTREASDYIATVSDVDSDFADQLKGRYFDNTTNNAPIQYEPTPKGSQEELPEGTTATYQVIEGDKYNPVSSVVFKLYQNGVVQDTRVLVNPPDQAQRIQTEEEKKAW